MRTKLLVSNKSKLARGRKYIRLERTNILEQKAIDCSTKVYGVLKKIIQETVY